MFVVSEKLATMKFTTGPILDWLAQQWSLHICSQKNIISCKSKSEPAYLFVVNMVGSLILAWKIQPKHVETATESLVSWLFFRKSRETVKIVNISDYNIHDPGLNLVPRYWKSAIKIYMFLMTVHADVPTLVDWMLNTNWLYSSWCNWPSPIFY